MCSMANIGCSDIPLWLFKKRKYPSKDKIVHDLMLYFLLSIDLFLFDPIPDSRCFIYHHLF